MNYFLQVLDPFNCQKITFSECVQLFSAHMVPMPDHSEDMLEGTPLKGGRLPDHEEGQEHSDEKQPPQMVPLIERLNQMVRLNVI